MGNDGLHRALIVVVSGPGGVGKDTIVSRLAQRGAGLRRSRSWTTRPRRPGESDDAYRFVNRADFERHVQEGAFSNGSSIWAISTGRRRRR